MEYLIAKSKSEAAAETFCLTIWLQSAIAMLIYVI